MSLVNEMLNDLEKRNQTAGGSLDFPGIPEERHRPPYLGVFIGLLLILGLVFLWWQYADRLSALVGLGSKGEITSFEASDLSGPQIVESGAGRIIAGQLVERAPPVPAADSTADKAHAVDYRLPENELLGVQSFVEGNQWHVVLTGSLALDYSFELEDAQAISLRLEDTILRHPLSDIRHPVWVEVFSFDQDGDDLLLHVVADRRFTYQKRFQAALDGGPAILQLWINSQAAPAPVDTLSSEGRSDTGQNNTKIDPPGTDRIQGVEMPDLATNDVVAVDTGRYPPDQGPKPAVAGEPEAKGLELMHDDPVSEEGAHEPDQELEVPFAQKTDSNMVKVAVALTADEEDHKVAVQAAKLVQHGEHRLAESQLRALIGKYERSTESRAFYIALLLRQSRQDEALIQIEAGLAASANQRVFVKLKSRWLLQQQNYVEAYSLIKSHAEQSGAKSISATEDLEFVELLASLAQQNGEHQDALGYYQQLAKFNPKRFGYWLGMAVALESLQSWRQALGAYNAALTTQTADTSLLVFAKQRQVELSERLKN